MGVLLLGVSCFIHFLRVELEEVGDAVSIGAGRRKAVCLVNERVEVRVGLHQVRGHAHRAAAVPEPPLRYARALAECNYADTLTPIFNEPSVRP